jgi:predicted dehydrogenase
MNIESRTINWGIIGTGDVAEHKGGPALYKAADSRLVAVANRNMDKAEAFAKRHAVTNVYRSVDELLADPNVDAVYVATPPVAHPVIVERAAAAGKHILCEKPMATSVSECDRMIRMCRDRGVQLMIAYYRRFFPAVQKTKQLLDEGAIGEPLRARAAVAELYRPNPEGERAWLVDPHVAGGGFLTDVATHRLDLFAFFFGDPVEVSAMVDTQRLELAVDDASSLIVRFESGVHAMGSFNWNVDTSIDELEIWGSGGRIRITDPGAGLVEVWNADGKSSFRIPAFGPTHLGLVEHYVAALRNNLPNSLPGEEGRWATAITEAAYESSRNRTAVRIPWFVPPA